MSLKWNVNGQTHAENYLNLGVKFVGNEVSTERLIDRDVQTNAKFCGHS